MFLYIIPGSKFTRSNLLVFFKEFHGIGFWLGLVELGVNDPITI